MVNDPNAAPGHAFPCGASGSLPSASRHWKNTPVRAAPNVFPQILVVQVKAFA
jgi:hypothetical protein